MLIQVLRWCLQPMKHSELSFTRCQLAQKTCPSVGTLHQHLGETDFTGNTELISTFEPLSPYPWLCKGAASPHLHFSSSAELLACRSACHQAGGSRGGSSPCPMLSIHVVSGIPSPASQHISDGVICWLWASWGGKHPEVSGFFQVFSGGVWALAAK